MTNQESTFPSEPKWVIDRPLMDAIVLAIVADEKETPLLPGNARQVSNLADQVYNLDEMLYYLDTEDTDVTMEHMREGATKLVAKAIRFLQSLPNE
jgi:hypothetical protein